MLNYKMINVVYGKNKNSSLVLGILNLKHRLPFMMDSEFGARKIAPLCPLPKYATGKRQLKHFSFFLLKLGVGYY